MKKITKQKWLNALRSGKFKQGFMSLCYGSGDYTQYCCLGVLAKITGNLTVSKWDSRFRGFGKKGNIETGVTIPQTKNGMCKLGLPHEFVKEVMGMNDAERKTFPQIADYIEKNLQTDD